LWMFCWVNGAGVRRTPHFFTCACNLHLSPLVESVPLGN
jgi:hypothetical protein